MSVRKASPAIRRHAEERGWYVRMLWQPPWLFPNDGRRLKNCAIPTDPWWAYLGNSPEWLGDGRCVHGQGATPDEAVLAAIPPGLRAAMARLEVAIDSLRDCLQK